MAMAMKTHYLTFHLFSCNIPMTKMKVYYYFSPYYTLGLIKNKFGEFTGQNYRKLAR